MPKDLASLVAATPELAAMPATSAQLLKLLEEPDTPGADIVAVIEKDPGLTANLLKLANSAYYGLRREVASARDALVMLGSRTVLTMAFAASMGRLLQMPVTAYRLPRGQLWRHCLAVGLLATRLVPGGGGAGGRNRVFTAGVVHDLGKLLLDRPLRERLEVLPQDLDADGLVRAERQLLGFDHAEAGAKLAAAWNFPTDLVDVIAGHHAPAPAGGMTAVVRAADLIASRNGHDGGAPRVSDGQLAQAIEAAGLDPARTGELVDQSLRDLDGLLVLLGADA
ncbi:MAG TPA: HDOD domain-containing protein [Candidatus Krumholzibacteria bacterium]|nr:HDOD domain-containing protein [Candidatus Krumholzibacteria bacterium]HPD72553.1 HDOD domain-containing protein [Candidatus Krumholzibacteria bacterium]HRY40515.1 HDOD domain-containing protein [Candidatus Krumholzibacteria bacterium]